MKKHVKRLKAFFSTRYGVAILAILLFGVVLRFYNYENRFVMAGDQAINAVVGRYAVEEFKLPLLGPFSSAGPFQTGGEWYWIIMLGTILFPFTPLGPWMLLTLLSILFIWLVVRFAYELQAFNKKRKDEIRDARIFSLIIGCLAVVSFGQIWQSYNLTNQTPISLLSLLSLWSAVRYLRGRESRYIFFSVFCASLAASIHLQGVLLVIIPFIAALFTRFYKRYKDVGLFLLGGALPLLPIFVSDLSHNFFNFKNMIYYYIFEKNKISYEQLGRRWLTYFGVFWPSAWAYVIGGFKEVGYLVIAGVGLVTLINILKKTFNKEWWMILLSFLVMIFILKYTRTPIFENYIVFLHPFIFLFTTLLLFTLYKKIKIVGVLVLAILIVGSLYKLWPEFQQTNYNSDVARAWQRALYEKYPDEKFVIYDYRMLTATRSFALVLYLYADDRIDDNGRKIGVKYSPKDLLITDPLIHRTVTDDVLVDVEHYAEKKLSKEQWFNINPSSHYSAVQNWQKD